MTREKTKSPPATSGAGAGSVKGAVGPVVIHHPAWPLGIFLTPTVLGGDNVNRVYAVGTKDDAGIEHYLVRISSNFALESGLADVDPTFGEAGFVPIVAGGGLLAYRALQIVEITAAHLTICFEVLDPEGGLYQTALFRFLIDGQVDMTFGTDGVALFPQLPEPASPLPPVAASPTLEPLKGIDEQARQQASRQVHKARDGEWRSRETGGAVPGANGKALANGQVLLVAYKKRPFSEKFSYLIKVNEDGTLDSLFASGAGYLRLTFTGSSAGSEYRMSADSTARSVVVSESQEGTDCLVARLTAEGTLDPGFGGTGLIRISSPAGALYDPLLKIDGNDKAVISVRYQPDAPGDVGVYLFRLEDSGGADPAFNNGNPVEFIPARPVLLYAPDHIDIDGQHRVVLRGFYFDGATGMFSLIVSRFTAQGIDTGFGDAGSYAQLGAGTSSGGLTAQADLAVVVSSHNFLWKLVD